MERLGGAVGETGGGGGEEEGSPGGPMGGGDAGMFDPWGGCSRRQARDMQCVLKSGSDG